MNQLVGWVWLSHHYHVIKLNNIQTNGKVKIMKSPKFHLIYTLLSNCYILTLLMKSCPTLPTPVCILIFCHFDYDIPVVYKWMKLTPSFCCKLASLSSLLSIAHLDLSLNLLLLALVLVQNKSACYVQELLNTIIEHYGMMFVCHHPGLSLDITSVGLPQVCPIIKYSNLYNECSI